MQTMLKWVTVFLLMGLVGCGRAYVLVPAPQADAAEAGAGAEAAVEGVEVIAAGDVWTGLDEVKQQVTPIRLTLFNRHPAPLAFRYENLKLVSAEDQTYAALPPFEIEGSIDAPVLAGGYRPIYAPRFYHREFRIAPHYEPIYPEIATTGSPFYYDPYYYNRYYQYWREIELPTPEMLEEALPEGVVESGGEVAGFVYFERIGEAVSAVALEMALVNARTGKRFGTVRIPFVVRR